MVLNDVTTRSSDPVNWLFAFLVLAIRRCQSFFEEMGVPAPMTRSPQPLMSAARSYLKIDKAAQGTSETDEEFDQRTRSVRYDAFAAIATAYGADAEIELQEWMRRHFGDRQRRIDWWVWGILLPKLADAWGNGPPAFSSPLSPTAMERFQAVVRRRYSLDLEERLESQLEQAGLVPLDTDEQDWATVLDDEGGTVDDLQLVGRVIKDERTLDVWTELIAVFDQDELSALVRWGQEVSATTQTIDPDLVRLPRIL